MVVVPAFTYFFTLWKGIVPNYCGPRGFLPSLENLENKIKVQNVIFIFLKQFPSLSPEGEDTLAWAASPHP